LAREAPLSTAAVVLLAGLVQGGLGRLEGLVLLAGLVGALAWMLRRASVGDEELTREVEGFVHGGWTFRLGAESLRTALGLAGTLAGAQLLVWGAQGLARQIGLSEGFVGLSIVALGTSLPELVTGIQAARRRETDLVVGNLLGSNLFNSFAVAGAAAVVGPGALGPEVTTVAVAAMVVVALAVWLFMRTGRKVQRWEAAVLLAVYPVALGLAAL
jgi:cation:H+ antiporter